MGVLNGTCTPYPEHHNIFSRFPRSNNIKLEATTKGKRKVERAGGTARQIKEFTALLEANCSDKKYL